MTSVFKMKKVLITGTFDIIHPGHLNLIKQAQELGDFLIAVIARDKNVIKAKGDPPYFNEKDRLNNLKKLNLIDKVILGDLHDLYKVIKEEKPDIITLGYDQKISVDKLVEQLKIRNSYLPDFGELSRTAGMAKLKIIRLQPFKEDFCKGKHLRKAAEDKDAGFLLIDKPMDWTSHDVVAKLRSITGIRQIGHTGTLDPFATGLLICAVGNATKMVGLFDLLPKTYEAEIRLGMISDTYDRTGQITNNKKQETNKSQITDSKLQTVLQSFIGKQKQLPPMYSAKKIQGRKLYELARKGIEVERKASEVEIYGIEVLGTSNQEIVIRVKCSAGTYIRILAYDIGKKLGTGAVLWELKRTAIGNFGLEQAVRLSQLSKANWQDFAIKPLPVLEKVNKVYLKGLS